MPGAICLHTHTKSVFMIHYLPVIRHKTFLYHFTASIFKPLLIPSLLSFKNVSLYCFLFASTSSFSALINHSQYFPAISVWPLQLFLFLLDYSEIALTYACLIHSDHLLQKFSWSKPWKPIELWDVEAPTSSRQSVHRWRRGCEPYAPAGRGWVDTRTIVQLEGLGQLKNPMIPSGIEPATFWLVA
jgi:hypothetical protein